MQDRVFKLDRRAESAVGALRFVAAGVVALSTFCLAVQGPGLVMWVIIVLAWLATAFWLVAGSRARRRVREPGRWFLALRQDALELAEGERTTRVAWGEIKNVEVDEDRLVIVVERQSGPPVVIEPRYESVTIHELRNAIAGAVAAQQSTA